jgi:hypothetical protein
VGLLALGAMGCMLRRKRDSVPSCLPKARFLHWWRVFYVPETSTREGFFKMEPVNGLTSCYSVYAG